MYVEATDARVLSFLDDLGIKVTVDGAGGCKSVEAFLQAGGSWVPTVDPGIELVSDIQDVVAELQRAGYEPRVGPEHRAEIRTEQMHLVCA